MDKRPLTYIFHQRKLDRDGDPHGAQSGGAVNVQRQRRSVGFAYSLQLWSVAVRVLIGCELQQRATVVNRDVGRRVRVVCRGLMANSQAL